MWNLGHPYDEGEAKKNPRRGMIYKKEIGVEVLPRGDFLRIFAAARSQPLSDLATSDRTPCKPLLQKPKKPLEAPAPAKPKAKSKNQLKREAKKEKKRKLKEAQRED